MQAAFLEQMARHDLDDMTFEDRLALLIDREIAERRSRALQRRLKKAQLRHQDACFEDINLSRPRGLDRSLVLGLGDCVWVRNGANILITGPCGTGKSWIACAFAHKACLEGYQAQYLRVPRLLTDLRIAHGEGTIPKLYRDLARIEVLRGRSERMFGTLQKRLPQELRLAGITEMAEANRFLREVYLPLHNARFATPAEDKGSAFVPFAGALDDILCVQQERTVGNDNTVRYHGLSLHIPPARHRHHYVKARVRVHEYPDGTLALFHGPRCLARYNADGEPIDSQPGRPRDPLRRSPPVPCGQVDSRAAPDHFPTGQTTSTEAVNSFGT